MDRVIGIDLGTTNSCVAVLDNGTPTVIPNRGGYKTTPSMVAVTDAGKRLVGHIAKRQAITNAENTVYAAKRLIGRKWGSTLVKSAIATSPFRIVQGPHDDVRIRLREQDFSVPEISAMVLQEMKVVAEDFVGGPVTKAVITVPAYFNDNQRQATKDAGEIAGLEVMRIINEPTAAALSYGFGKDISKTIAVYDFGGGTFDISILEIGEGSVFKVLSTGGDTFLGGEDVDARIEEWLVNAFREEHGVDLRQDRMALQRMKDAAEKAKCELSGVMQAEINLPFISQNAAKEALHLQRTLKRDQLEKLCGDLVAQTIEVCRQSLEDAGLRPQNIDEVVLVGGMTRMPIVTREVARFFGREPSKGIHPDECVALGAAVQGAALVDKKQEVVLLDVTPHALGIAMHGGAFDAIIEANTTVPTQKSKSFTTNRDGQTRILLRVLQGQSDKADENELLGEFALTDLRSAGAGAVEIDVSFEIDSDGIVRVRAKDLETKKEQTIEVSASSGLTKGEVKTMRAKAATDLGERRASEEFEAAKQQAEALVGAIAKLLPQVEKAIAASGRGSEGLEKARALVSDAKAAITRRDLPAVKDQVEKLGRAQNMLKVIAKG